MPKGFKHESVLIGDSVTANEPITRLYHEEETHQGSNPRFLWPSLKKDRPDAKEFVSEIQRPIWFEVGFGSNSLLPFAKNANRVVGIDTRPWIFNLFKYSNSHEAIDMYQSLQSTIPLMMEIPIFLRLKHMAGQIQTPREAGIALFLLTRLGGKTKFFKTFEASVSGFDQTGSIGCVPLRRTPLVHISIFKKLPEATKTIVHTTHAFSDRVHLHFNQPPSENLEECKNMLYHLNKIGYSWTLIGDSKRYIGKLPGDCVTLDKTHIAVVRKDG